MRTSKTIAFLVLCGFFGLTLTVLLQPQDTGLTETAKQDPFTAQLEEDREPASVPAKSAWTAQTHEGFEFKIRQKNSVQAVWVMKRDDHFDVIFANNTGSRVNLTIPAQQFYALKNAAADMRAPASDMSKCKDNFMQLEMVDVNTHKLVATCMMTKGKDADLLRQFGAALTQMVR